MISVIDICISVLINHISYPIEMIFLTNLSTEMMLMNGRTLPTCPWWVSKHCDWLRQTRPLILGSHISDKNFYLSQTVGPTKRMLSVSRLDEGVRTNFHDLLVWPIQSFSEPKRFDTGEKPQTLNQEEKRGWVEAFSTNGQKIEFNLAAGAQMALLI